MTTESADRPEAICRAARVAADELEAFIRLFEERRETEARPHGHRADSNVRAMEALAPAVQRSLEFVGRSWLHEDQGGRPLALVHAIAFGRAEDYEPIADRALAQLRGAEASFRTGHVGPGRSGRRRRRRSPAKRLAATRGGRIGAILLGALVVYAIVLGSCGNWDGSSARPRGAVLTGIERAF
ncbi:MAG: hypothetical protein WC273_09385 [Dehalococcoidia bacterium]